ncbi:MAG: hypothetical protein ACE5J5_09115 [Candidatus Hydrothermarchaeales archaeon]
MILYQTNVIYVKLRINKVQVMFIKIPVFTLRNCSSVHTGEKVYI